MGQGDNTSHFIFVSNNPIPLPIAPDDHRFLVTRVSSDKQHDINYFSELLASFTPEFYQNLMFYFLNLNIGDFAHRDVPLTEAKQIIQDACRAPIEQFIRENFRAIQNITGPDLFELFKRYCKAHHYSIAEYGKKIFIEKMRENTGPPSQQGSEIRT